MIYVISKIECEWMLKMFVDMNSNRSGRILRFELYRQVMYALVTETKFWIFSYADNSAVTHELLG